MPAKTTSSAPRFETYRLFVTAKEFGGFFEQHECRLFKFGSSVLGDFGATPIPQFLNDYAAYVRALLRNPRPYADNREIREAGPLRVNIGLASDWYRLKPIHNGRFFPEARKPSIHVAPQNILWADDRIHFGLLSQDMAFIGLELYFPLVELNLRDRVVRRFNKHPHYKLFQQLQEHFNAITTPCTFNTPVGERRTKLRVSTKGKELLKKHRYLLQQKLKIV